VPVKVISSEKASSLLPIMVRTLCADLPLDRLQYILTPILCQLLDVDMSDSDLLIERDVLHPAVSKAQAIIREQCADRVDISDLASSVDLDMRYLISLFRLATGTTPHQFQIAMRVEMARALLEQHLPLCEVAARSGFADQSHLNRHFRRRYGLTPGVFREAVVMHSSIVV
jgi:transcriptional regulator GlxA family with amidase domain